MAKVKEEKKEDKKDGDKALTPEQQAMAFFKKNKDDHYNFEKDHNYKVKSSSLKLTAHMDGGLSAGAHRFMGVAESGKTSCALDFMYNFLGDKKAKAPRRGIYIKSEGRLSENVKRRSGLRFVYNPEEWVDGTCLVIESNIYDFIFDFINSLIKINETETEYFIIMDSMDTMIKKSDLDKNTDKALQVAGGAVLTSSFLKKASIALSKRGHVCIFVSQYRETISDDKGPKVPRQGSASGGHALEHSADWAFEFLKPRDWAENGDIIREGGVKGAKAIGHVCRMRTHKSPNEKTTITIDYPIKYGRVDAKSVWLERELGDFLLSYGWYEMKGAGWLTGNEERMKEIKDATGIDFPLKIQGMENLYLQLEANPKVAEYLFDAFVSVISG